MQHQALCITSSLHVNSKRSYGLQMAKLGFDLCDLDLWPWPFAWIPLVLMVITPENFMMIQWQEHCEKSVTDRQTDGQMDVSKCSYSFLVAAKKDTWYILFKHVISLSFSTDLTRTTRTPVLYWYPTISRSPILLSHIGSQVKRRQSQCSIFKEFKFKNKLYTWHTFWRCLIRCANMKWIRRGLLKIQSRHDSVHRWTDEQMDKVKAVYPPFNFVEAGGMNT